MKKISLINAILILSLLVTISCGTDSNDDIEDGDLPTIIVENVTMGGTLNLSHSEDVEFVVSFSDGVGLESYSISIEGTDIDVSETISGTEYQTSVGVGSLEIGVNYSVQITVVNTENSEGTFSFNLFFTEDPPFTSLYMIGNASPNGWNIESPDPMDIDPDNPWVFQYEGDLVQGEFKISTFTGDWCDELEWIRPLEMHPPLTNRDYIVTVGCPPDEEDYKWFIDDTGVYSVVVDLENETIDIEFLEEAEGMYQNLYLVGDATPGDWSLDDKTEIERSDDNVNLFSWTGDLTEGTFKISTDGADFGSGDWIHPVTAGQDFSETAYEIFTYSEDDHDDNQWVVEEGEEGTYSITIDLEAEEIHIEKQ